jgi:hypothetical protein
VKGEGVRMWVVKSRIDYKGLGMIGVEGVQGSQFRV